MRLLVFMLFCLLALQAGAGAQEITGRSDRPEQTREEQLAGLFEILRSASDERTARRTEDHIFQIWMESGSPTINVLMSRTMEALDNEEYPLALDLLDRITVLSPDYAEGWNKRATAYFLIDDYGRALADLERVLALEPRHFGAMAGLGQILREVGDNERALKVFRKALEIDPHMEKIGGIIDEIEKESGGRDI